MNITLTVLGLINRTSGELNRNAEGPQFTFDLKLIGKDLNPESYVYVRVWAYRNYEEGSYANLFNNITIDYEADLILDIFKWFSLQFMFLWLIIPSR